MRKCRLCAGLIAWVTFLGAGSSLAVTVEVVPSSPVVGVGDSTTVDLVISGLGDFTVPSLGTFDLALCFDPDILGFVDVEFGPFLGDAAASEAITGFSFVGDDLMAFEVSLLLPEELIALQPDSFILITVAFDAQLAGTSPLDLILNAPLGDESGAPLAAGVAGSSITVESCSDSDTLCLRENRFTVEAEWRDFQDNTGSGQVVAARSRESGLFWFFDAGNWEVLVKVLDGCAYNDHFWVFAAASSNVEYTLRVTDTVTGSTTSYFNPLGNEAATITDATAFAICSGTAARVDQLIRLDAPPRGELRVFRYSLSDHESGVAEPGRQGSCTPSPTELCLNGSRFLAEVEWRDHIGAAGSGRVVPFSSEQSGLFWFFAAENWEMLVKVLDGCAINDHYWVFSASATDVEYTIRVVDTESGAVNEYFNPLGTANDAVIDILGFGGCP